MAAPDPTHEPTPAHHLLIAYKDCLVAAITAPPPVRADRLLPLLLSRERLAYALRGTSLTSASDVAILAKLDLRLRHHLPSLGAVVGSERVSQWHAAFQPPATSWWWTLTATPAEQPNPLWPILIGIALIVTLSLALDIAMRLQVFGAGADFTSILIGLAQVMLPLLAGSALTNAGRIATGRILDLFQIRRYRSVMPVVLACVPLLVVGVCWLAMPAAARWYYQRGFDAFQAHRSIQAIPLLARSTTLDPTFAPAFYTLGVAYEDALEYDSALRAYRGATGIDPAFYPAYNNMARLYVLRLGDSASALDLLMQAFDQNPPDTVRPTLLKNRGWARLVLGNDALAERDLREALALKPLDAETNCVLARLLEMRPDPDQTQARTHWQMCLAHATDQVVAAELLDQARERAEERSE